MTSHSLSSHQWSLHTFSHYTHHLEETFSCICRNKLSTSTLVPLVFLLPPDHIVLFDRLSVSRRKNVTFVTNKLFSCRDYRARGHMTQQAMAIFQSAPSPPPPTFPASCTPFFFFFHAERRQRSDHTYRSSTLQTPPHPPPQPSVHVPPPATPQQQGPEPLLRSQSITAERGKETEKGSKGRERMGRVSACGGGVGWGKTKVRCHET